MTQFVYITSTLKLHFQIPCVFPVRLQMFPVQIYVICNYYIHKTDLADSSSFKKNWEIFAANMETPFTFKNQGIYNLSKPNSLCFGKISKFPAFSPTGIFLLPFSCLLCAVGDL